MEFMLWQICLALLLAECFVGVTVNVFIAAVQIMKWKTLKTLDSCEKILLCLAISRSLYLANQSVNFVTRAFFPWLLKDPSFTSANSALRIFLLYSSNWFTAVLCVFYCVKIANYRSPVFLFMKTRISRLVPQLLVASLLISLAFTLVVVCFHFHPQNSGNHLIGNVIMNNTNLRHDYQIQTIILSLFICLPFIIFCGAVSLLIRSLWLHIRQMRSSGTSFPSPKLEAHFSVVKSMILFLCCQILYFGCFSFMLSLKVNLSNPLRELLSFMICAPSFLHSSHLVYSNTKLKQAFIGMCRGFKRCI